MEQVLEFCLNYYTNNMHDSEFMIMIGEIELKPRRNNYEISTIVDTLIFSISEDTLIFELRTPDIRMFIDFKPNCCSFYEILDKRKDEIFALFPDLKFIQLKCIKCEILGGSHVSFKPFINTLEPPINGWTSSHDGNHVFFCKLG